MGEGEKNVGPGSRVTTVQSGYVEVLDKQEAPLPEGRAPATERERVWGEGRKTANRGQILEISGKVLTKLPEKRVARRPHRPAPSPMGEGEKNVGPGSRVTTVQSGYVEVLDKQEAPLLREGLPRLSGKGFGVRAAKLPTAVRFWRFPAKFLRSCQRSGWRSALTPGPLPMGRGGEKRWPWQSCISSSVRDTSRCWTNRKPLSLREGLPRLSGKGFGVRAAKLPAATPYPTQSRR